MKAAAALKSMLGRATTGAMPPDLVPVDWIMQRWWVTVGGGMPTEVWDDNPKAKLPPLDPQTAIIVDREYLKSPPLTKRVLKGWYSSPVPTSVLARDWGMSERTVERGLHVALNFMRYRFEETRHAPLIRLLTVRIDHF